MERKDKTTGKVAGIIANLVIVEVSGPVAQNEICFIQHPEANLMAVDTHVFRVSHRLGLSDDATAVATEATLVKKFKTDLHRLHQGLVLFGRYICTAKNPKCDTECFLKAYCKSTEGFKPR